MRQTNRVAELMRRGAAVEKAKIHRRLVCRNAARIGTDIRPGAVVRVELDSDFRIGRVVEVELQVRHLRPPIRLVARNLLLGRRAVDETHAQGRTIHPGLADRRQGARATLCAARGALQPHQFARQKAIDTNFRSIGHMSCLRRWRYRLERRRLKRRSLPTRGQREYSAFFSTVGMRRTALGWYDVDYLSSP